MSSLFTYNYYISETPPTTEALVPRTSKNAGNFMSGCLIPSIYIYDMIRT